MQQRKRRVGFGTVVVQTGHLHRDIPSPLSRVEVDLCLQRGHRPQRHTQWIEDCTASDGIDEPTG
jgi:hypothetical protein